MTTFKVLRYIWVGIAFVLILSLVITRGNDMLVDLAVIYGFLTTALLIVETAVKKVKKR